MIHKSEWCWDTAEEGQSLRGEAWSGSGSGLCAKKITDPYLFYALLRRPDPVCLKGPYAIRQNAGTRNASSARLERAVGGGRRGADR